MSDGGAAPRWIAALPVPAAGFGTARRAIPIALAKQIEEHDRCRDSAPTASSLATRPDAAEAAARRNRVRHPWRSRSRHPARTVRAAAPARGRAVRESSGSAASHRGSGSGSRRRRGKPARETRPISARRSRFRPPAIRRSVWRASAAPVGSREGSRPHLIPCGRRAVRSVSAASSWARSAANAGVAPCQCRSSTESNNGMSVRSVASVRKSKAL